MTKWNRILILTMLFVLIGCEQRLPNTFTLDTYNQIEPGMNYEAVRDMLGEEGQPIVDSEGEPLFADGSINYKWKHDKVEIVVNFNTKNQVSKTPSGEAFKMEKGLK